MINLHHCTFTKYFLELNRIFDFQCWFSSLNIVEKVCCPKVDYLNSEEKFLNKFTITVSAENDVMFFMLCRSLSSFASHHEEAELTEKQVVHSGQTIVFFGKQVFWKAIKPLCIAESLEAS